MRLGYLVFSEMDRLIKFGPWDGAEECAVLLGFPLRSGSVLVSTSFLVPNRSEDPGNHFRILRSDIIPEARPFVVGVAHSHGPRSTGVSYDDVAKLGGTNLFGLVYHAKSGMVKLYDATGWVASTEWRKQ